MFCVVRCRVCRLPVCIPFTRESSTVAQQQKFTTSTIKERNLNLDAILLTMPSSSDMEARLKDLESILGHRVCLLDEPLEQATGPEAIKKSEVVHAQKKEQVLSASPSADCATQGSESASNALEPDDSMVNNRDTLPFADMKPQDLSNEKVSFCPWKVVLSYPECFTGKANRPRVCDPTSLSIWWHLTFGAGPNLLQRHSHIQRLELVRSLLS